MGKYAANLTDVALVSPKPGDFFLVNSRAHSICTTIDGRAFPCDTDYHRREELSVAEISDRIRASCVEHVCITGGEPFIHDLRPLIEALWMGVDVHIETSGTKPILLPTDCQVWVTCCPKEGYLRENDRHVDEWKFLVDEKSALLPIESFLEGVIGNTEAPVSLQPINGIYKPDSRSMAVCVEMLSRHPEWALSVQLHKFLGVR